MKRVFAILAGLMVLLPGVCGASGYLMVNYGVGGTIDEPSMGIELGGIFLSNLHPRGGAVSIGVGLSVADTDEDMPSAQNTYPLPPLSNRKDYNDGDEQEINAVIGAELKDALFVVGGIGYATQKTVTFGWNGGQAYEESSDTEKNATFMLGLRYIVEGLDIGVGFHSRRGIMAGVGIAF
jgi:hypothetical protein